MASGTVFPTGIDNFPNKFDNIDDILAVETNTQSSAIQALEAKVGVDNSLVITSHDYRILQLELSGSGDSVLPQNIVQVHPTANPVTGKIFNTWTAANDYLFEVTTVTAVPSTSTFTIPSDGRANNHWINGTILIGGAKYLITASTSVLITISGTHLGELGAAKITKGSATNRWGIQISGTNSENGVINNYIQIVGIEGITILTGLWTIGVDWVADLNEAVVTDCEFTNFANTDVLKGLIAYRTIFSGVGAAVDMAALLLFNYSELRNNVDLSTITGFLFMHTGEVSQATLPYIQASHVFFLDYGGITFNGGSFVSPHFAGSNTFNAAVGGYRFTVGYSDAVTTFPAGTTIDCRLMDFNGQTINNNGDLITKGCTNINGLVNNAGATWQNFGSDGTLAFTKYTFSHTAFQTAGLTNILILKSFGGKYFNAQTIVKHSTMFAGTGITEYKISVGPSGFNTRYCNSFNVATAVSDLNMSNNTNNDYVHSGSLLVVQAVSVGANLDQSTAGVVDVMVLDGTLPI